jgi:transposase
MIVDNATYFKAKVVSEWIENNDVIELDFLPPYTPNLNLIERFWRFAKEKLVKNKYYEKYKTFRAKVFQFLNNVDQYVKELESLMVEKFEIVKL